jgi:hydroxymethylpyrimidine/phosphomethylpyrimidine kinase
LEDNNVKKVLTIAGSDCSGGAGIQADIKTITAHKIYAMSVITALTAQNTTGVYGVLEATPEFVNNQLDCVFDDIRPDTVKIGMVSNIEIIKVIAQKLCEYKAENIVVDPVMVSTSGSKLLNDNAIEALITNLFPLATVITPNIPEAESLAGFSIGSKVDMQKASEKILKMTKGSVLIKGGHLENSADDLLNIEGKFLWFETPKVENPNTHGTGCTLSSAIACNLALGLTISESVKNAKEYITGAIKDGLKLGKGRGPLNHSFNLSKSK